MSFLHPWAIALGAIGIGLPILVHWLTRPRPVRLPLSTIRFVHEAVRDRRARYRLRDLLILLARAAAVAMLAWAFARPLWGERPLVDAGDSVDAARIVILDTSQSMAARSGSATAFDRARPLAAKYLSSTPKLRANLILAGARPRAVFEGFSNNFSALHDALERATTQPGPERLDIQAAITTASELLSGVSTEGGLRRELIVISDFQRSNWSQADFSALPEDTLIQLESVAPESTPDNLGVLSVVAEGRAVENGQVRVNVEIGNHADSPRTVIAELQIGEALHRLEGLCPPNTPTTLTKDVILTESGWQQGEVRLIDLTDALPADNARPFVLEIKQEPTYALMTRQRDARRPTSSFYLERALVPTRMREADDSPRVVRIDPEQIDQQGLAEADLFVLDHPGQLSSDTINMLTTLIRRGRGLLYVASEPMDATNLAMLKDSAGSDLQWPVEYLPPSARRTGGALFLAKVREQSAPFDVFGDQVMAAISPLRFAGRLDTRRTEGGLEEEILAEYSDRSACLTLTSCGLGRVAVLNTDLAESNLPRSPVFVPFIGELVGRLLDAGDVDDAVPCGEPMARFLPPGTISSEGLSITGPDDGVTELGVLVDERSGVVWRWPIAGPPGVYEVRRDTVTVLALPTAIPAAECDLSSLTSNVFVDRLAGGRSVAFRSAFTDRDRHDDRWSWFAVACVAFLMMEMLLLRIFRT